MSVVKAPAAAPQSWSANPMFANDTGELEQYDMRYSPSSQEQHAAQSPTAAEPPASQSSRDANPLYRDQSDEFQKYNAGALTASGPITQALPHEMQGKHGGHKHTKEPLSSESSEDPMFLEGLSTISEAAVSFWTGYRVSVAHCLLFLLSAAKITGGLLWIKQPAASFVVASGVFGIVDALHYAFYRCLSARGSSACSSEALHSLRWQTLMAQILGAICIPPSAILDGMYISGLFRQGLLTSSMPAVVAFAAVSVLQSASFLVVVLEAMEARNMLRYEACSSSHSCKKLTAESLV